MSNFIQAEDGYYSLGTLGYYILIAVLLIALLLSAFIVDKKQKNTHFSVKRLSFCGVAFPCSVSALSVTFSGLKQDFCPPLLTVFCNSSKAAVLTC
jgi:hypothetical protein